MQFSLHPNVGVSGLVFLCVGDWVDGDYENKATLNSLTATYSLSIQDCNER